VSRVDGARPPELLVGAWGWEHPAWVGPFYPDDMPAEWRLTYYANAFQSVLVPRERLARASREDLRQWGEDVPAGFVFYLEVGVGLDPPDLAERVGSLGARVGGLVVPADRPAEGARVAALEGLAPLAWLLPPAVPGPPGQVAWRSGAQGEGGGCFGLMDGIPRDLRGLRAVLETFQGWARGCPRAMLCFPGTPGAWREMEQARVIASLLGG
jgi:hypothetical protein